MSCLPLLEFILTAINKRRCDENENKAEFTANTRRDGIYGEKKCLLMSIYRFYMNEKCFWFPGYVNTNRSKFTAEFLVLRENRISNVLLSSKNFLGVQRNFEWQQKKKFARKIIFLIKFISLHRKISFVWGKSWWFYSSNNFHVVYVLCWCLCKAFDTINVSSKQTNSK